MNILIINPFDKGGGAEGRIQLMLDEFQKDPRINNVHFLVHGEPAHKREGKIDFWRTLSGKVPKVVEKLIKEYDIQIVQQHNFQEIGTRGITVANSHNIPTVYFAHDYKPLCWNHFLIDVWRAVDKQPCYKIDWDECERCIGYYNTWLTQKNREVLNTCTIGIAAGYRMKQIFEGNDFLKGKWEVVTPWVDVEKFKPGNFDKQNQCCVVNNYIHHKGAWVVLKAWKIVSKRLPQSKLVMQGDERCLPQMIDMIRYHRLPNVSLIKRMPTEELQRLYCESNFTVVPSIWEATFELVRAESLLCGTPVIASRIGVIPETSECGHVLFEPRNHEELASKMIDLFLDDQKAKELGMQGREYAYKTFNPRRASEELISLYSRLVG